MSNELATTQTVPTQLPAVSQASLDMLGAMTTAGSFLSRMRLFTKGKAVNQGLVSPGEFGIQESEDRVTRLGKSIDVIVIAVRAKASDFSDLDNIINSYDMASDEFKRIQAAADVKGEDGSSASWGPSFLLYERNSKRFLEWHTNTASARREAGKLGPFLQSQKPCTLGVRLAEKGKFSWHCPTVNDCSTPITLPSQDAIDREVAKFMNPPTATVETATAEEEATSKRRSR